MIRHQSFSSFFLKENGNKFFVTVQEESLDSHIVYVLELNWIYKCLHLGMSKRLIRLIELIEIK